MNWQVAQQALDERTRRYRLSAGGRPLSFAEVIAAWADDPGAEAFGAMLAEAPFAAFFLELPPLTRARLDRPFECVLVDSPALAQVTTPEPGAFAAHFRPGERMATFANLGGDALLVAPAPADPAPALIHLAAFLRAAPREYRLALWPAVARALHTRLGEQPLWLSTSGLGVYWLHLRLDRRPKYYQHGPYRDASDI